MVWKIFVLLSIGLQLVSSCDMDQVRQGCRIQNRGCSCGAGCISEYRYETIQECQNALRGKRSDICFPNPCQHGGSCLQISQQPGFRCRCEGTGYFGAYCNRGKNCYFQRFDNPCPVRACPIPGAAAIGDKVFPYECIVI